VSADPRNAFLGAWRLVHSVEYGPGGEKHYPFGEDAIGYIMYNESGVMAVQITRGGVQRPDGSRSSARKTTWLILGATSWMCKMRWFVISSKENSFRVMPRIWKESITFSTGSFRSNR
jgi:hypothetical protein